MRDSERQKEFLERGRFGEGEESLAPTLTPLSGTVTLMLAVWCILLVLGALPALMLTGMSSEVGDTFDRYYTILLYFSGRLVIPTSGRGRLFFST